MRQSNFNRYNIHRYEEDLSPLGRRVLMVLINQWNSAAERERHESVSNRRQQQRFARPSKVLTFDDANISPDRMAMGPPRPAASSSVRLPAPLIPPRDRSPSPPLILVPTSGQMVTPAGPTLDHTGLGADGTGDITSEDLLMLTSVQRTSPGWQHMFDPQLLSDAESPPFSPQELTPPFDWHQKLPSVPQKPHPLQEKQPPELQILSPIQGPSYKTISEELFLKDTPKLTQLGKENQPEKNLSDVTPKLPLGKDNQPAKKMLKRIDADIYVTPKLPLVGRENKAAKKNLSDVKAKRKVVGVKKAPKADPKVQSKVTDSIEKKVKRIDGAPKNPFRKQKYTKAVTNWLKGVDAALPVDAGLAGPAEPVALAPETLTVQKKASPANKVIQAQLTNIGGVMKFGKPDATDGNKVSGNVANVNKDVAKVSNETVINKTTVKKTKRKFVAPLKSQTQSTQPAASASETPTMSSIVMAPSDSAESAAPNASTLSGSMAPSQPAGPEVRTILPTDQEVTKLVPQGSEVVLVLLYKSGRCELQGGEPPCSVQGVLSLDAAGACCQLDGAEGARGEFLEHVVTRCRVVCYDGKALLRHCMAALGLELDRMDLDIMDMKVAGSLLSAASPPTSLRALQELAGLPAPPAAPPLVSHLQRLSGSPPAPASALAVSLREVATRLVEQLKAQGQWTLFRDIEMKVLPIIAAMEHRGVPVSLPALSSLESQLSEALQAALQACHAAHGAPFQPLAPRAVRAILYDQLQLDTKCNLKVDHTPRSSDKSTSESMLRKLSALHPLPRLILRYRRLHKALAFVRGIRQYTDGDVLKPTWYQCSAATGRITCTNPNVQALPKRPLRRDGDGSDCSGSDGSGSDHDHSDTEADANAETESPVAGGSGSISLRRLVQAGPGCVLVSADYRQAECRLLAAQARDRDLLAALAGPDLFTELAHQWRNIPAESVSAAERELVKRCVYAAVYGCGAERLASISGQSPLQARAALDTFHRRFPALRGFAARAVSAAAGGAARLASGRALPLPDIRSQDTARRARARRQAVNFMVQGSAADLCKLAMVRAQQALALSRSRARLLLSVHDELVWEVEEGMAEECGATVRRAMERAGPELVPGLSLQVALTVGPHWGHMRPLLLPHTES